MLWKYWQRAQLLKMWQIERDINKVLSGINGNSWAYNDSFIIYKFCCNNEIYSGLL